MTTEQLRALVVLASERRLTTAARRLGVTQPGLSRQLQALEGELGVKLFVRTPRGVTLTEGGERFLLRAQRALDSLGAGLAELQELSATPRGFVALGSVPTVGAYLLPELIPPFHIRYPEIVIRLTETSPDVLEEHVASGRLDLAIVMLPIRRLDLVAQKLWEEDFVFAVPRSHKLARRTEGITLAEVVGEPLVVVPNVPATRALEAACLERGQTPHVVLEADNSESIRRMVERGLGIALLPAIIARASPVQAFVTIPLKSKGLRRQMALVHRGDAYLSAAARALKQEIVERTAQRSR
jgi:DNA-binding transcriptional LysR family regulator